jgi:hypothetical protein
MRAGSRVLSAELLVPVVGCAGSSLRRLHEILVRIGAGNLHHCYCIQDMKGKGNASTFPAQCG